MSPGRKKYMDERKPLLAVFVGSNVSEKNTIIENIRKSHLRDFLTSTGAMMK